MKSLHKGFAKIIFASMIVFLFGGISHVHAVTSAPNKTNITAEILNIQQIDSSSNFASNYVSILKIKVTSRQSIEGAFSVPDELEAYVHRWTNDLSIISKLEKGQTITATISYSGDEHGGIWDIREIKVSTSPIPTKPVINAIKPTSGPTDTQITITGTGFTSAGNIIAAYGNLAMAMDLASSDGTSLTFKIPAQTVFSCEGACPWRFDRFTPGSYPITVTNANGTSNWIELKITTGYDTPVAIISLTPASGPVGTQVKIYGDKFTICGNNISSQGQMIATNVCSPEGTILYFNIPAGLVAGSYPIIVTNTNGTSNSKIFIVTASNTPTNTSTNSPQPANAQPTSVSTQSPLPFENAGSTSAPIKVEVSATETAISGPQPTTSKTSLPSGCTRENETVTCPTSETKPISVQVSMSTNSPLEAITIQKQTDGTIGITSHEVTAVTTEKVTIESNHLFLGSTESAKPISVLPNEAKNTAITSAELTSVATTELKTEEQKPIYLVQGTRNSKLLFFIPVSIKTTTKIDATSGEVISIQRPWWNFLTW